MILKHFLKFTAVAAALFSMGFAASCSDDDPVKEPSGDWDKEVKAKKGVYTYDGTTDDGLGNFIFCFTTANVTDNALSGPGDVYFFDLYSGASDAATPLPKAGTYTFDATNSYKEWTFAQDDSYFGTVASGSDEVSGETKFTDGTLTITVSGSQVIAEALVTLNGEKIKLSLTSFSYIAEQVEAVDLERDLNLTCVRTAGGILGENGDIYQNNTTAFVLFSYADKTNTDLLCLTLIGPATPAGTASVLPAGTYTIGTEPNELTCIAGDADNIYSTHYENPKTGEYGWLTSGTVKVSVADGMVYTIEVDAKTDLGYSVKSTYVGGFEFNGGAAPTTTLTEDHNIDFSSVTSGNLIFYGNWENCGMNLIVIDLDPAKAKKDGLGMYLFQSSLNNQLEEHTYVASNNFATTPYCFIPGSLNDDNTFNPTTFYIYDAQGRGTDVQAPIHAGTIEITQDGANWNFEIDVYDDANNHITGSWTGPLKVQQN